MCTSNEDIQGAVGLGVTRGVGANAPPIFFLLTTFFFYLVTELERGKSKNWGDSGGKEVRVY